MPEPSDRPAVGATDPSSPAVDTTSVKVNPEYDLFVERLAQQRDPRTISNSSAAHALSILRAIFRHAKQSVSIFSGKLDKTVYGDEELMRQINKFRSNKGVLRVLLQDQSVSRDGASKLLLQLHDDAPETLKQITPEHPFHDATSHFVVADGCAYRIETDTIKHMASGSFNDAARATLLDTVFNQGYELKTARQFAFAT